VYRGTLRDVEVEGREDGKGKAEGGEEECIEGR